MSPKKLQNNPSVLQNPSVLSNRWIPRSHLKRPPLLKKPLCSQRLWRALLLTTWSRLGSATTVTTNFLPTSSSDASGVKCPLMPIAKRLHQESPSARASLSTVRNARKSTTTQSGRGQTKRRKKKQNRKRERKNRERKKRSNEREETKSRERRKKNNEREEKKRSTERKERKRRGEKKRNNEREETKRRSEKKKNTERGEKKIERDVMRRNIKEEKKIERDVMKRTNKREEKKIEREKRTEREDGMKRIDSAMSDISTPRHVEALAVKLCGDHQRYVYVCEYYDTHTLTHTLES
jgi:flagellar biosynthesis GTPase FlhF